MLPCYNIGITGKGIRVAIVDDGIEYTHMDLKENYVSTETAVKAFQTDRFLFFVSKCQDSEISFDAVDNDLDPIPDYTLESNNHGTSCAGIVAMKANDVACGVGVAFNAKVGGKLQ